MIHFKCTCGNALFFDNTACLQCGSPVGYDPATNTMRPVDANLIFCRNGTEYAACNWLVPAADPGFCIACKLNRIVPDLTVPQQLEGWRKMEAAKRRVIYSLLRMRVPFQNPKANETALAFQFLAPDGGQAVTTGHSNGLITLNILEADDVYREHERHALGEPYRTLVGHFRHELGHYFWDCFFRNRPEDDPLMVEFRGLFGDERDDYVAALQRHYTNGPAATWPGTHITSYAASHPWEDWSETWAQYLHILDGVETAQAFGWASEYIPLPFTPFSPAQVLNPTPPEGFGLPGPFKAWRRRLSTKTGVMDRLKTDADFLDVLNQWARLSPALNELSASLGHASLNPFIFSLVTVKKILFVHQVTSRARKPVKK